MGNCLGRDDCQTEIQDIYDLSVEDIDGNKINLSQFQGQAILIVNVASRCGLTDKNYFQLSQLHEQYHDKGLNILAFPCNQFFGQEPGNETQIKAFAKSKGAKFLLLKKVIVNGEESDELFRFLRQNSRLNGGRIGWNFGKFLVNKQGKVHNYYSPNTDPEEIKPDIERLL